MLMIGILLAVLKTLLFLILLLFCLILLLLLLLLLSPFSYRFEAARSKEGENRAHFSVRFLFGLFRFWAGYERELSFQAKLFLFTLLDSGGESREESRSEMPRPGPYPDASDTPRPTARELRTDFPLEKSEGRSGEGTENSSRSSSDAPDSPRPDSGEQWPGPSPDRAEKEREDKPGFSSDTSDSPRPIAKELRTGFSPEKREAEKSEERAEEEIEPPPGPAPDDLGQEGKEAGERTRGPAAGEKESSRDGLKRLRLLLLEENREALLKILRKLRSLLRHWGIRRLRGEIIFGMEDPYLLGKLLELLSFFYPLYGRELSLEPHFGEKRLEGWIYGRGHIRLIHLVLLGIPLLMDRRIRGLISGAGGEREKREEKEMEEGEPGRSEGPGSRADSARSKRRGPREERDGE